MTEQTKKRIRKFVEDRDWSQFHSPANLAKSISIEANELLECFQWSDTDYNLQHVKEELSDVLVYCQDMLDALNLNEDEIINMKMDVQENETMTNVKAMSRILRNPPVERALLSSAVDHESGNVISKSPKNESAKTTNSRKKKIFTIAFVLNSLRADAPKMIVINKPKPT